MAFILTDSCVWFPAVAELVTLGHDVLAVPDVGKDPGDIEVLTMALRDQRILITLDKDFGELAVVRGLTHCGIVRLVDISGPQQGAHIHYAVTTYSKELEAGAIVTVEPFRVRVRPG